VIWKLFDARTDPFQFPLQFSNSRSQERSGAEVVIYHFYLITLQDSNLRKSIGRL